MRTPITYLLTLLFLLSSSFVLAEDFEGVIHMKKSTVGGQDEGIAGDSDWYIKGDNIRTERRAQNTDTASTGSMGGMIYNADTKKGYVIMPGRKMYMELSETTFEKTAEHLRDMKHEILRTGKTDTVAGYQCEVFQTKSKETGKIHGEACAAKGLGNMGAFMGLNRGAAANLPGEFSKELTQIVTEGYFLLRMVRKDDDGSEKMRMEATSIEKKKLDNSLFLPPGDYTKFDMDALRNKRKRPVEEGNQGEQRHGNPGSTTP
jgi:hypothetical protein